MTVALETSFAELKLKAIQLVVACDDERLLEQVLRQLERDKTLDETEIARRHFEEFDRQYSSVLKRLAE